LLMDTIKQPTCTAYIYVCVYCAYTLNILCIHCTYTVHIIFIYCTCTVHIDEGKGLPQQAEVSQAIPSRLRPRIFLTFGTTRVVGRQPYTPAAFTPEEITGTHFQGLSRPQDTWFRRGEQRKKPPVTPPGIDPGTSRLLAQCLNHYTTPDPILYIYCAYIVHLLCIYRTYTVHILYIHCTYTVHILYI
jgi:hypothetical protein